MNRSLVLALVLACGGSEPPRETVVTLPARAAPSPVATLSIALPQTGHAPHAGWRPPAPIDPPDVAAARRHFASGVDAYDVADYARALKEFETAYAYSPRDALLYNIGTVLERLGRRDDAIAAYRRYLKTLADPARAAVVRTKIDALRKRP